MTEKKEPRIVTLPSGATIKVPGSMTDKQVMARAQYEGLLRPEDEGWLASHGLAALGATGETAAGIASLFSGDKEQSEELKRFREQSAELSNAYPSLSNIPDVYRSAGIRGVLSGVPTAAGYDIARILPELGAAGVAAAAAPEIAGASFLAPTMVGALTNTGRNINAQQDRIDYLKQHPEEATAQDDLELRRGAALAAGVPQAVLDTALLGRLNPFSKAAGSEAQLIREAAGKTGLIGGAKRAASSLAKTSAQEAGTEVAQDALERAQAREALTSPEAYESYLTSGISGALLGGGLGAPRAVLSDAGTAGRAQAKMGELSDTARDVLNDEATLDPAQFKQYGRAMAKAFADSTRDAEHPEDVYTANQAYQELKAKVGKASEAVAQDVEGHVAGTFPTDSAEQQAAAAYKDTIEAFKARELQDEEGNIVQDMRTAHQLGMKARSQAITGYAGAPAPTLRQFEVRAKQRAEQQATLAEQQQAAAAETQAMLDAAQSGQNLDIFGEASVPRVTPEITTAPEGGVSPRAMRRHQQDLFALNDRLAAQEQGQQAPESQVLYGREGQAAMTPERYAQYQQLQEQKQAEAQRQAQAEAEAAPYRAAYEQQQRQAAEQANAAEMQARMGAVPQNHNLDIFGETQHAPIYPRGIEEEAPTRSSELATGPIAEALKRHDRSVEQAVPTVPQYVNKEGVTGPSYADVEAVQQKQRQDTFFKEQADEKQKAKLAKLQEEENLRNGTLPTTAITSSTLEVLDPVLKTLPVGTMVAAKAEGIPMNDVAALSDLKNRLIAIGAKRSKVKASTAKFIASLNTHIEKLKKAEDEKSVAKTEGKKQQGKKPENVPPASEAINAESNESAKPTGTAGRNEPAVASGAGAEGKDTGASGVAKRAPLEPSGVPTGETNVGKESVSSALDAKSEKQKELVDLLYDYIVQRQKNVPQAKLTDLRNKIKASETPDALKAVDYFKGILDKPALKAALKDWVADPKHFAGYSKAAQQTQNPHTVESLHSAIRKQYGANVPEMEISTREAEDVDATTKGFYDPETKRVVLIADNIDQGDSIHGLVRHEVAVHAKQLGKSDAEFRGILNQLQALRDRGDKTATDAYAKVPKDTAAHLIHEEALGYLVEHAPNLPIVKRFMSWLRRMAHKLTGNTGWLSSDDLVKMADDALKQKGEYTGKAFAYSKANTYQANVGANRQRVNAASDSVRPVFLKAMSAAGIHELATEKLLPGSKAVLEATRRMIGAQSEMQDDYAHIRKDINKFTQENPSKVGLLGDIAMDATLLGVKMGSAEVSIAEAKKNLLATKPEGYAQDLKRLEQLGKNWSRLGKAGQGIYHKMSKYYNDTYVRYIEAQYNRIENSGLSEDEKDRRKAKLTDMLESTRIKGDYFPVMRFGKYGVSYTELEKDPVTGQEVESERKYTKFDTSAEAKAFLTNPKVHGAIQKDIHRDIAPTGVDSEVLKELYDSIDQTMGKDSEETRSDMKDIIMQMYLMGKPEQSVAKQFMHRKGTAGYSNDIFRGFDRYAMSMSRQLPRIEYGRGIEDQLRNMKHQLPMPTVMSGHKDYEQQQNDSLKAQDYYEAFQNEILNSLHPKPVGAPARFVTGAAFHYYLASVGSAATQLASVPMLGLPAIAKQHSFGLASSAIKVATDMYLGSGANADLGWWDIGRGALKDKTAAKLVRGAKHAKEFDPAAAYKAFMDEGAVTSTVHAQSYGGGDLPTGAEKDAVSKIYRVMDKVASPFGQMEAASRQIVSMAAYIANMKSGMTHEQAVRNAIDLTYRDMGDYGATGRSALSKSDAGRILWQFQQYGAKMLSSIAASIRDMKYGSVEEKRQAKRHLMGVFAMHGAFAGVLGLPGAATVGLVADLLGMAFGDDDDKYDYDTDLRNYLLNEGVDKTFVNVLLEGPIATMTNLDLRPRIGAQDVIPLVRESNSVDSMEASTKDRLLELFGGASASMLVNIAQGGDAFLEGEMGRAAEKLMPNAALRSAVMGVRYALEGKTTKQGEVMVAADEVSLLDSMARAVGIEPLGVAKTAEAARTAKAHEVFIKNRHAALLKEYRKAEESGDTKELDDVMGKIDKFNAKYPEQFIGSSNIAKSIGASARQKAEMVHGYNYGKLRQRFLDEYSELRDEE